ncbi:MAG: hypothetical protein LLG04_07070 [Parachlamydia sp.]|nr:hypothetical protein [Parachlamydia sp.]
MNRIERVFNVDLWGEGRFDPSKYQGPSGIEKPEGRVRWHMIGLLEEFMQRMTGIFWSDRSAKSREDLALVADIRQYCEQLKASDKQLSSLEKRVASLRRANREIPPPLQGRLAQARRDWEKIVKTLQKLKSNYSRTPSISNTASYQKLHAMENAIDAKLKKFMYTTGDPGLAEVLNSAQEFELAFYYNTLLFPHAVSFLEPAQKQLEALQKKMKETSDANPFNRDLKKKASQLISTIRQEMIDTYLRTHRNKTRQEVKTFADAHAHAVPQFTPEMKSLLKLVLSAQSKEDFAKTTSQLKTLKEEASLDYLKSIYAKFVKVHPNDPGLQALASKAAEDIETIRQVPVQQCLQHIQAAVAGVRNCPNLIKFLEEITATKEMRDKLKDSIQPAGHVSNLLFLTDVMRPYYNKARYSRAHQELFGLKLNALSVRMEGLTEQGKSLVNRTPSDIKITSKLALIGALYDGEFCNKYQQVLDQFDEKPSLEEAAKIWKREIHPFLLQPALQQKVSSLNPLGPILAAQVTTGQIHAKDLEEAFAFNLETLKCVQHVRTAIPELGKAHSLLHIVEELASLPDQRSYLLDEIRPERGSLNLILLAEKMTGSDKLGGIELAHRAHLDLERLQQAAFAAHYEKLSEEGKRQMERTQALVGKNFPLPIDGKLVLLHCLHDPKFSAKYSELMDDYLQMQKQGLAEGLHQGTTGIAPAMMSWREKITSLEIATESDAIIRGLRRLEDVLQHKIGLQDMLLLEQNIPGAILNDEKLMQHRYQKWMRPVTKRREVAKRLENNLCTDSERLLLSQGGFAYSPQIGCYEHFSCQAIGVKFQEGMRRFTKGVFQMGYGLPGVGITRVRVPFDLSTIRVDDLEALFAFIQSCMEMTLPQLNKNILAEEYLKNANFQKALGEKPDAKEVAKLLKRIVELKEKAEPLLRGSYIALGHPDLPAIEGVEVIPWQKLLEEA